jgi:parvulin-like peptidyl-prolyl isomerase
VLVAVIAIPVLGYYFTVVRPNQEPLIQVNDKVISIGQYIRHLRAIKNGTEALGGSFQAGTEPFQLQSALVDNELIRQAAPRLGISVTEAEVTQEISKRLLPQRKPEEQVTEQELQREFKERLRQWLGIIGLSESEYRDTVRADLLRENLRQFLGVSVPTVADQVRFSMIQTSSTEAGPDGSSPIDRTEDVQKRLQAGEPFAEVAMEISLDFNTQEKGGEVGWVPRRVFLELDEALFSLPVGQISDPVFTTIGTFILLVHEKAENREIEEADRDVLKTRALQDWLEQERASNVVKQSFSSQQYEYALEQVRSRASQQQPQQNQPFP